jgi:hypothetical protein
VVRLLVQVKVLVLEIRLQLLQLLEVLKDIQEDVELMVLPIWAVAVEVVPVPLVAMEIQPQVALVV